MKLKTAGLTAIAAMALLASYSAGSASATTLCKVSTTPCPTPYVAGDHLSGTLVTGTVATLTASPQVNCSKSTMTVKLTNATGAGSMTGLTFSECKSGSTSCSVTVLGTPFSVQFDVTGSGPNGTATVSAGAQVFVVCTGLIDNCTYIAGKFSLSVTGGAPATITANAIEMERISGTFCPSALKWDGVYSFPNLWVRP
jgi:hypothetical protein